MDIKKGFPDDDRVVFVLKKVIQSLESIFDWTKEAR
jgi:hypothetical protein